MQSTSVFLDITKVAAFRRKNTEVSRTQEVSRDLYSFGSSLFAPLSVSSPKQVHRE